MNRTSRLGWWWRVVWSATVAAFGRQPSGARTIGGSRTITASFAGPGSPPDLSKLPRPTWLPPDDEMGVATGLRSTLVSDEHHAVVLVDCVGYSNGFEFTISYRSRDPIPRGLLGIEADREISVRIEYPNGRNSTSHDRDVEAMRAYYQAAVEGKVPPLPAGPVVMPQRGGGGGKRYEWRYWCWPLPPEGPIKVTAEWAAAGIGSTTIEIDASSIHRAGLSSGRLWND
jgi:hypothetical protein